ncbi:hypothetical protein [Zoogloea sp.]|uniref:hypothetical protein n=1 Tax=Zoogloea sp. TaxID=49181 RepID=UPI0026134AA7|nr:hypothetical protein [Zoogloea sp.]MDD3352995.1 hypothetical protein [Zoogloea sp.]
MKINLLPIGARFEYEGETYTKTGPITAVSASGCSRMIPRYAVLHPADGHTPPPPPIEERQVALSAALAAFERYHGIALSLTESFDKARLEEARKAFLKALS